MEHRIKKLEEVWTADGRLLGTAQKLYHRLQGVNPAEMLFATYLKVENFDLGTTFFVPTDYLENQNSGEDRLRLSVSLARAQAFNWDRLPTFLARGEGKEESLAGS